MATFHIPDMSCGHCKATIENTVLAINPEAKIEFDMEARQIKLDGLAETANVQAALAAVGYPATPA